MPVRRVGGPARCWPSPPTTATPTRCATRAGDPVTAALAQPRAVPARRIGRRGRALRDGVLADVAPTLLELVGRAAGAGHDGHRCIGWLSACYPSAAVTHLQESLSAVELDPLLALSARLASGSIAVDPAAVARRRPGRDVRRRVVRLPQPARRREAAVPVHGRPGGPVRGRHRSRLPRRTVALATVVTRGRADGPVLRSRWPSRSKRTSMAARRGGGIGRRARFRT